TVLIALGDRSNDTLKIAEGVVAQSIASPPAYTEDGVGFLAGVTRAAEMAKCLPMERRIYLARDYARRALDEQDIEQNRAEAVVGCTILAPEIVDEVRAELHELLLPLATGSFAMSKFDVVNQQFQDPLGALQLNLKPILQRRALEACVHLSVTEAQMRDTWRAAQYLLQTAQPEDSFAAAHAGYVLAERGFELQIPWRELAQSPDSRMRRLAAALTTSQPAIEIEIAQHLARDTSIGVRVELAVAVSKLTDRTEETTSLREILRQDHSYRVRNAVTAGAEV
ncbi:MAG: hypothetical protein WAW17_30275, partial [Rhodococcus sp. (in: high G+C Gram-positive bacteria)]|uniref:hypothetical protein n=1 Tax=Rhodococcus sp. TaxID=1831 RepID=UPI003BAFA44B